jgi:hypothetical protein
VEIPACAVGRLDPDGPWIGFAPTLDDGYALTLGPAGSGRQSAADPLDLLALAVLYFEDAGDAPPEELAATHGDIRAIVRHAAERIGDADRRRAANESVDAIDDGLAADVVMERLERAIGDGVDALDHLRRRAADLAGGLVPEGNQTGGRVSSSGD